VEFVVYAVLGWWAAGLGGVRQTAAVAAQEILACRNSRWWQPVAGGITVGLLGWFAPDVLGVGYGAVGQALNGHIVLGTMALLVVLKLVATATCYASGNAGGIFGPSLFIGAMLGGTVGSWPTWRDAGLHGQRGRLRAGRHGRGLRRHHSRAVDLRHHDLRSHARLHHHRAADDRQSAQLYYVSSRCRKSRSTKRCSIRTASICPPAPRWISPCGASRRPV
jgi:hypothetical protein